MGRALLSWLNGFPDKPVQKMTFEYLPPKGTAIALVTVQSAYKIRQYLRDSYRAQYQFQIVYRSSPSNDNERLEMDELLNQIGLWAETNPEKPTLEGGAIARSVTVEDGAAKIAEYEDGSEDHQITLNLVYEVI